jgi:hypothetical protein
MSGPKPRAELSFSNVHESLSCLLGQEFKMHVVAAAQQT